MCIICVQYSGTKVSEEEIRQMWNGNQHGGGFMFVDEYNRIQIRKSLQLEPFLEKYNEEYDKYKDTTPFVLHFRIATHGDKDLLNCHPFIVNRDIAVAHNGVINADKIVSNSKKSDTRQFVQYYLKNLPHNFLRNVSICNLIQDSIGTSYNKLAFLTSDREVHIFNKSLGVEDDGRWFSNSGFRLNRPHIVSDWYDEWYAGWNDYYNNKPRTSTFFRGMPTTSFSEVPDHRYCRTCKERVVVSSYCDQTESCYECSLAWAELVNVTLDELLELINLDDALVSPSA